MDHANRGDYLAWMLEYPSLALDFAFLELFKSKSEVLKHGSFHFLLNLVQPGLNFLHRLDNLGEGDLFCLLGNHGVCTIKFIDMELD